METYKVTTTILKGYDVSQPHHYSEKIVAKKGTLLLAVTNGQRIGGITELWTKSGKYVCDVESVTAKKHCIKMV